MFQRTNERLRLGWALVARSRSSSAELRLQAAQVALDFGSVPVLCAYEFAADDSFFVDDVGFGRTGGSEGEIGLLAGVEYDGHVGQVVVGEVLMVGVGVGVEAYGQYDHVWNLLLKLLQRRKLLETGRAPRGPEIEDDNFAAVLVQAYGLRAVMDGEVGGARAYLVRVASTVAAGGGDREAQGQDCCSGDNPGSHIPIIRGLAVQATALRGPPVGREQIVVRILQAFMELILLLWANLR